MHNPKRVAPIEKMPKASTICIVSIAMNFPLIFSTMLSFCKAKGAHPDSERLVVKHCPYDSPTEYDTEIAEIKGGSGDWSLRAQ